VRAGDAEANSDVGSQQFFLPIALTYTDALQVMYGALEDRIAHLKEWSTAERHFRAFAKFLGDKDLRNRAKVTCFKGHKDAELLGRWTCGTNFSWKWEYLEKYLRLLLLVLVMILDRFNRKQIMTGSDSIGGLSNINASVLTAVEEALAVPNLMLDCLLFRSIAFAIRKEAGWFELCPCHSHLLQGGGSFQQRLRRYRSAAGNCWRKGRRVLGMVSGHIEELCDNIMKFTTKEYRDYLCSCASRVRHEAQSKEPQCDQHY
jgi:hypothetical protein